MPKGYPPSVFVSSTCYDLNQVRADLKRFLESIGLDPILSETPAFPTSPQISPIENCLRAVKERADIFVIIVGSRYGSQNESGKSVTNLEYLEAKAKGIPVYAFVSKPILNALPIWKKNPNANYDGFVDTPKLFEFVDTLRSSQDHWVYEFEEVLHIAEILRRQLGYLFMEGLSLRETFKNLKLPASLANLSGTSLRLLLEKPTAWEYKLFTSVLDSEMDKNQELKWDLQHGVKTGAIIQLEDSLSAQLWVQQRMKDAINLTRSASKLMNKVIQEAVGKLGEAGDPEYIVYAARRLAVLHKKILEWSIDFICAEVPPKFRRLFDLISNMTADFITQLESIPSGLDMEIVKAVEAHEKGLSYAASFNLKISIHNIEEIEAEFQKIQSST